MKLNTNELLLGHDLDNGTLSADEKELVLKIRSVCMKSGLIATEDLENEIFFRCIDLEVDDIEKNIWVCIMYSLVNGFQALFDEEDDGNIWEFI